jgi:hypothetical protein
MGNQKFAVSSNLKAFGQSITANTTALGRP